MADSDDAVVYAARRRSVAEALDVMRAYVREDVDGFTEQVAACDGLLVVGLCALAELLLAAHGVESTADRLDALLRLEAQMHRE